MKPLDPRLVRYAGATRWYLLACVAIGVAGAGLIVAQATLLADGIVGHFAWPALAAVVAGRAFLAWLQELTAVRAAAAVKTQLRGRLLAHVARVGPFCRTGEMATLVTRGVDALDGYFARYLPQLVLAAVVPVIVLARMLPADLLATVTVAVTLPLIPVFLALVGWTTEARNRTQFDRLTRLAHRFLDTVAGLPTLKVFGRAKAQAETIRRVTDSYRRASMGTLRVAFVSSLVLELVATISVALVAVGVGLRLVDGRLDLRTALLVLILAPEAYLPLRLVGTHFHASAEGLAAAEKIFTVLATPAPRGSGIAAPAFPGSGVGVPTSRGSGVGVPASRGSGVAVPVGRIRLDGVTVTFPGRAGPALDGVDLTIRPGEVLALTGPSGGGKSTLLSVLLGFVPYAGRISMSDVDFREADLDAWRRQFAWAPQRPYLFAGTVADNVRMGTPARASLVDDLRDVVVGENGAGLSAGQRQRVALARALHRDAPVLLLDEPTANLDGATEATVLAAIRRAAAGRTVVLVAHRPELLALADRVVRLEDGRVVTGVPA